MSSNRVTTGGFHGKWFFWALLLLGLLASSCNSSLGPTAPEISSSPAELEFQLLQLTNSARSAADVEPPLGPDPAVAEVARNHSRAMRDQGFFGHVGPDGRGLRERLQDAGIDYSRASENLAQIINSANPADQVHSLLMDSDPHQANILDSRFELVGIGVAASDNTLWVTQIFIKP